MSTVGRSKRMDTVIGSNGLVGHSLMRYLDAIGTFRNCKDNLIEGKNYEYLDITEKENVNKFFEAHKPKRVFLAAANPWVDGCENPDTDIVNILGVRKVIDACSVHGSQLIFFSSSYVFDGDNEVPYRVTEKTFPINRYGRQKEQIEQLLIGSRDLNWLIIRTVGVFGHEGSPKNFVSQIHRAVKKGMKIYVPSDQTMNPVWSMDLAKLAIKLSDRYTREVFHVAGNKCLSKYEFAINVAYKLGCKKPHELIVGMKSSDMKSNNPSVPVAIRPKNGCLDCGQLQARAMSVPNFEKGLWRFLKEEYGIESRKPTKPS
jgi:dTDP-4-dehydrorhamnose reductase